MMRVIYISILLLLCFNNAYAYIVEPYNFYTGFELGESANNRSSSNLNYQASFLPTMDMGFTQPNVANDSFGGRAYLGYELSKHVDLEGGYTQYADTKVTNVYGFANESSILNEGVIDTLLKWSTPITNTSLSMYVEGGGALVMTQEYATDPSTGNLNTIGVDALRPMYGLGMTYELSPVISLDLSWSEVASSNTVPTSKLLGLGINFHIN